LSYCTARGRRGIGEPSPRRRTRHPHSAPLRLFFLTCSADAGIADQGERFDAILCDIMMPEMTGMEVHATVAKKVPEQAERFVFVTGGAFTPAATDFVGRISNTVLEKPYDLRALNAALAVHLRP
jgi:CheY-like chemotaxis protein